MVGMKVGKKVGKKVGMSGNLLNDLSDVTLVSDDNYR